MGVTVKARDAYRIEALFSQTINISALKQNICTGSFGFYGSLDEWFAECKLSCNNNICQLQFLSQEILTSGATTNSAHRPTQLLPTPRGADTACEGCRTWLSFTGEGSTTSSHQRILNQNTAFSQSTRTSLPSLLMTYHKVAQQLPSIMPHPGPSVQRGFV